MLLDLKLRAPRHSPSYLLFPAFSKSVTFTIQMDHMPLVRVFTRQPDAYISLPTEFNCSLQHLPGRKNPVANALSRVSTGAVNAPQLRLNYNQLAKEQQEVPETSACRISFISLKLKDFPVDEESNVILCDISTS